MAKEMLCKRCEVIGKPKRGAKGSLIVELLLWAVGIVGIFTIVLPLIALGYSLWRLGNKPAVCRQCGSTEIIPTDSPAAERLM